MDPKRIIQLQQRYQTTPLPLWLRGRYGKMMVYPFYGLFAVATALPLFYAGRAILSLVNVLYYRAATQQHYRAATQQHYRAATQQHYRAATQQYYLASLDSVTTLLDREMLNKESLNKNFYKVNSIVERKLRKFLSGPKKGETFELKNGLVSQYKHERKDAIQRVIQAMTVGKDVSSLFPDVLKNIATYDLEQKKLVYLYLMNYAKTHPELCILAVNTFVQDTEDPNPLIRALAIRTMGCIRVAKMVDYMEVPLTRTLKDENPYVRKTAAICIAKLFDLNPEMCVGFGFLNDLEKLLSDANPMVVANAINALYEIRDMNEDPSLNILVINGDVIRNLLLCLNECTEWGRITILTTLTEYDTRGKVEEANHIIERVIPQLQHVNPSVVLSSIKAILCHIESIPVATQRQSILRKLSAPLVSLVSSSIHEAQYVGLKNIRIILEKYPNILSKELRVFFIKYSDPLYLKLEKLEIMIRLANESNSELLLGELREYAMEFEPALVTKAIKSIGAVAIKLSGSVIKAVNLLNDIIDQRGGELIINEATIQLTNVLRRYPNKSDIASLVIPMISNHVAELNSNEALAGYVWILGSHPKYFTDLHEKLQSLIDGFLDYDSLLQLNILTTVVKINLESSNKKYSPLLQKILELATKECENADVRDKAYIYWRLLSSSTSESLQKKIILTKLPPIHSTISAFNPQLLETLMRELSTLSSVYYKPAESFIDPKAYSRVPIGKKTDGNIDDLKEVAKQEIINSSRNEDLLNFDDDDDNNNNEEGEDGVDNNGFTIDSLKSDGVNDLLKDLSDLFSAPVGNNNNNNNNNNRPPSTNIDILELFNAAPKTKPDSNTEPKTEPKTESNPKSNSSGLNNDLLDLF
ncbi:APL2 [Candida oxycetoniae]|uniref:AP complex subunit beta n=1 Tax=Candida oxycetoniae TaxID=497107 RepID=A0AAI9WYY6_9ASCO|nr:APL2 [Candida oxycetoniae]KAI3405633.2 APL2 [Candida oxycetoniae]